MRRQSYALLCLVSILLVFPALCAAQAAGETIRQQNVLLMYADNPSFPAYRLFTDSFKTSLDEQGYRNVSYAQEYLEWTKYGKNRTYADSLTQILRQKYALQRPDLIVLAGGPAATYVLGQGQTIFAGTPVIITGNSLSALFHDSVPENYFPLVASYESKIALQLIQRLQPGVKKVYYVAGVSDVERQVLAFDQEQFRSLSPNLEVVYWHELPFSEIIQRAQSLEESSVIFFRVMFRDAAGISYVPAQVAEALAKAANRPVYGSSDSLIGTGIVGGYVSSNRLLGIRAAELGARILSGEPFSLSQITTESCEYLFDVRQLRKWKIAVENLPPGSRLEYDEPNFLHQYRLEIIGILALVALQALLIIGFVLNLIRRKQAEKNLSRLSDEMDRHQLRLKLLTLGVESSTNHILVLDKELKYWWVNPAYTQNSGYSLEELIGKDVRALFSPKNHAKKIESLMNALKNDRSWAGSLVVRRKDDSEFIASANFTPIEDEAGNTAYYLAVCLDETENERVREALVEAQKAQAKAEKLYSIGTMASGVSHEINQPLNSIKVISGGLLLMLRQGKNLSDEEYQTQLVEITQQVDRIAGIIKYLHAFIREEQRRMVPCQVHSAMEDALKIVGAQIAEKGIRIIKDFDAALPPVLAHPTGLEIIGVNLLTNSIEALARTDQPDKWISVRTRFDKHIVLELGNNGPSIEPENQQVIFEPFTSFGKSGENQGLGLAIVRNTLNLYTGTIELVRSNDEGVLFKISLPAWTGGE